MILTVLQESRGRLHGISLEMATAARILSKKYPGGNAGLLITGGFSDESQEFLKRCGLDCVYIYENSNYATFLPEQYCHALLDCINETMPEVLLIGGTPEGRILAPTVAAYLKTGVTADCTKLDIEGGLLIQTRPAFGGNIMARIITPETRPQIATIRYGVIKAQSTEDKTDLIFRKAIIPFIPGRRAEWVSAIKSIGRCNDIVFAVGGGLGSQDDIERFRILAEKVKADLMCSRRIVEKGWFPQNKQIGLSGNSIAPKLLITFGISGSVQFQAGIQNVQALYSVNIDPTAPIMRIADRPFVGDLYGIAEELVKKL
jgi:electron transfer flavoprotein alpha subunit